MTVYRKKLKDVTTIKTVQELAKFLRLSLAESVEIQFSVELNNKIIDVVKDRGLTHAEASKLTGVGRTKITAIMNRNLHEISIKTLMRVLGGLGYKVSPKVSKSA